MSPHYSITVRTHDYHTYEVEGRNRDDAEGRAMAQYGNGELGDHVSGEPVVMEIATLRKAQ